MRKIAIILGVLILTAGAFGQVSNIQQHNYYASDFAYGWNNSTPGLGVGSGNNVAGTYTITLNYGFTQTPSGLQFSPMNASAPFIIGSGSSMETVAATSISSISCSTPYVYQTCQVTAAFAYGHGPGDTVRSATAGLQEAIDYGYLVGGGKITIDALWTQLGGSNVILIAALPYPSVFIQDDRGPTQFWNMTPSTASMFAAPAALTGSTVYPVASPAGSYTTGTYHFAYTPVDCMGNEGPQSADYSHAGLATSSITFTAPAAISGACGWIPYIGLTGGAATNEYQVQLFTQPTVIGAAPVSNGVCTLSPVLLQVGKYACSITNTLYGQTGSSATVSALTVVTDPQGVQLGLISTASYYQANSEARTAYAYAPGSTPGIPGVTKVQLPNSITTASASTVPQPLGMVELPATFMNYVGRTIEICGLAYSSTQGASTVVQINFEWDAHGSDVTTGLPVIVGGPMALNTLTTGTVAYFDFCQDIATTVASASATGGSLLAGHGYLAECALVTCATAAVSPNTGPAASASNGAAIAAVGSLNLAAPARIQVIMVQTTSTTAVPKLFNLSVKLLN